jgi:glucose 1-dehydrogenase
VRVLAIAPGAIRTPINADVWGNPGSLRDLDQKITMNRLGEPVDDGMLIYPDFSHGG